ncbi:MAG: head decoration protein [Campylobacterales bacterium]|nr:head decoration protein [Campylobacterales bacterium]
MPEAYSSDVGNKTPDNLVMSEDFMTKGVTIASGEGEIARGTIMARVTASRKYVVCDVAASDGSEIPRGILVRDVDATSSDEPSSIYTFGKFDKNSISNYTDALADKLQEFGIIIEEAK